MSAIVNKLDGQLIDGLVFCKEAYALMDVVRSEPDWARRLLCRSGKAEKRLLDEILPICRYVQSNYRYGRYISVCWKSGNQSYDAELLQSGDYVDLGYYNRKAYLEITSAMHENEHHTWAIMRDNGIVYAPEGIDAKKGTPLKSEPVVFTNLEHVNNFAPYVVASINAKSKKRYPLETSLIVLCHLNSLYLPHEWQLLASVVEREISSTPFREVLLLDEGTQILTALAIQCVLAQDT